MLTLAEVDRCGWDHWRTLNNRRQSIGPKPDSRPRLEVACYKYLTSCSRLLSPSLPSSHAHTCTHHQPDSSPPGLVQWACHKKASAYGSRVTWTPARRNNNNNKLKTYLQLPHFKGRNEQYSWHWRQSLDGRRDGHQDGCQNTRLVMTAGHGMTARCDGSCVRAFTNCLAWDEVRRPTFILLTQYSSLVTSYDLRPENGADFIL